MEKDSVQIPEKVLVRMQEDTAQILEKALAACILSPTQEKDPIQMERDMDLTIINYPTQVVWEAEILIGKVLIQIADEMALIQGNLLIYTEVIAIEILKDWITLY